MMGASKEVVFAVVMLLLLASLLLVIETSTLIIVESNCRQVREVVDEIKRLASSLRIDADDYTTKIERDACGS